MNSSVPNGSMVIERWCPEAAHRPTLNEAPVFYPSEEEFKDSLKYIASICQCVEPYGICRIVPPPSWNLPCTLKERTAWQTSKFATHVQKLDKLQNRDSTRKMANHDRNLAKRRRLSRMWVETGTSYGARENDLDCQKTREFGFELGPEFTLEAFQKYADDFKEKYFHLRSNQDDFQKQWEASVENIEEEYWRIVEMPTEEIEVLYGSDIETGAFGSGFPKSFTEAMNSDLVEKYVKSEWNLNNIARHPASMLAFESEDISGVILPWLYVGMCFSSFCWHVEDHHLYSLNYMHWGAPKIWYGVPGKDASKFEAAMRKHLPDLFEEQPDLLHKLVTQLSPSVLKSEAIPVYRCVQHPGEFVVTFPRAYHAGFSCGFNCAEAVNFAPIDWLPQGQRAVELYREQGRHTALSHDKLLLGAAREAVRAHWELQFLRKNTLNNLRWKDVCGKDGILTHALKKRVHMEQVQREYLSNPLKSMKMDVNFDEKIERECIVCHYDLHLSAVSCQCSPDSYACLTHAKQLCSCAWSMRSILFRYEINELNILLEALGGKLSAIHRWANLDLGLTLSSYVSRNKPEPDSIDKPLMEGAKLKEQALPIAINSNSISEKPRPCKEINVTMSRVSSSDVIESDQRRFNSTGTIVGPSPQKQDKNQLPSAYIHTRKGEVIGDNHVQDTSFSGPSIQSGEGALGSNSSSLSFQVCQLSREDSSYSKCIHGEGNSQESPALAPKDKHLSNSNLMASKVNILLQSEAQSALKECDVKDCGLNTHKSNASVMSERDANYVPVKDKVDHLLHHLQTTRGEIGAGEIGTNHCNVRRRPSYQNLSCNLTNNTPLENHVQDSALREPSHDNMTISARDLQRHQPQGNGRSFDVGKNEMAGSCSNTERVQPVTRPRSRVNYCRRKVPYISNVVRRINYIATPLEYGSVVPGKLWSNSQVIFPKGFKSRVMYISVLDPAKMCYYISEILDAGLTRPVFMVSVEECPSEVFIHMSAAKCWDLVRERVNQEINKHNNLGRVNLPHMQPPGCINGLEMFGFSSSAIIQAIEAIDCKRICSEYWKCRPESRTKHHSVPVSCTRTLLHKLKEEPNHYPSTLLGALFKKANHEELQSMRSILVDNKRSSNYEALVQLLNTEIHSRQN